MSRSKFRPALAAGIALVTITSSNGNITVGSAPVFSTYYFPHLALGGGWQTTLTYVNYSQQSVTCRTSFFSDSGTPLLVPFGGAAATIRTDVLLPGATVHQQSQANLTAPVGTGWAQAQCSGPVKASLLFRSYSQGAATGEAGVNAMTTPATRFVSYADAQTGIAYANPSTQSAVVTITALNSGGTIRGKCKSDACARTTRRRVRWPAAESERASSDRFGSAATSSHHQFVSQLRSGARIFLFASWRSGTPLLRSATYSYYFSHLALGGGWQTTVTYVNSSTQVVTCQTSFFPDSGAPLAISFGGRGGFESNGFAASGRNGPSAESGEFERGRRGRLGAGAMQRCGQSELVVPLLQSRRGIGGGGSECDDCWRQPNL